MSKGKSPMKDRSPPRRIALAVSTLLAAAVWTHEASAQVQKCVDPSTGKITFSDRGCSTGEESTTVRVSPANSIDGSQYRQQLPQSATPYASQESRTESGQRGTRVTVVGENNDSERQRKKLCKEASTPHKGAHGLTAAQRAHAAQLCSGISLPVPAPQSAPVPTSTPPGSPAVITSCDPGGCWDSNGLRYTQGAGTTYIPTNGGHACQRINGNMICP